LHEFRDLIGDGFVSDAFIFAGSDGRVAADCNEAP
jgi:hypothetical protein